MDEAEYLNVQSQIGLVASAVRGMDLDGFIQCAERSLATAPLLAPSHFIAGREKLEAWLKMARQLRAFQSTIPTDEQAKELDARAAARVRRLGIEDV